MDYSEEQIKNIRNEAFESGKNHTEPSHKTMEMINDLQKEFGILRQYLEDRIGEKGYLTNEIKEIKHDVKFTNGKVAKNKMYINMAMGGLSVVIIIVIPLIGLVWSMR